MTRGPIITGVSDVSAGRDTRGLMRGMRTMGVKKEGEEREISRARGNEKSFPGRDASHGRRRRIPRRIACTACRVSHLRQVCNAQHEAYRVQDVGFTGPVQAGDGVEQGVERRDNGPLRVGLEAVDAHFLDVHGERTVTSLR